MHTHISDKHLYECDWLTCTHTVAPFVQPSLLSNTIQVSCCKESEGWVSPDIWKLIVRTIQIILKERWPNLWQFYNFRRQIARLALVPEVSSWQPSLPCHCHFRLKVTAASIHFRVTQVHFQYTLQRVWRRWGRCLPRLLNLENYQWSS